MGFFVLQMSPDNFSYLQLISRAGEKEFGDGGCPGALSVPCFSAIQCFQVGVESEPEFGNLILLACLITSPGLT